MVVNKLDIRALLKGVWKYYFADKGCAPYQHGSRKYADPSLRASPVVEDIGSL